MTEPAWLEPAGLTADATRARIQGVSVQELFQVRRAAGKVLFNVRAAKPGADPVAVYRATMDRAFGLPGTAQDEARHTLDQEATLGAADYLRGWLLAAQLRATLVKKFGPSWWQDPAAGAFLKPLLAPGNAVGPDGLAKALGDSGISPDAFVAAMVPRLSGAGPEGQPPAPKQPAAPSNPAPGPSTAEPGVGGTAAAAAAAEQLATDAGVPDTAGSK
jgi:hypothetical protein